MFLLFSDFYIDSSCNFQCVIFDVAIFFNEVFLYISHTFTKAVMMCWTVLLTIDPHLTGE